MEAALAASQGAESYHFEMDMQMAISSEGFTFDMPILFEGDYQAPDRLQGMMSMSLMGTTIETEMITVGDTTYMTNPDTGEWEKSVEPAAPFSPEEVAQLDPDDIQDLVLIGIEDLDGIATYHLAGTVAMADLGDMLGDLEGEFEAEYWIAVEDGRLRKSTVEGEVSIDTSDNPLFGGGPPVIMDMALVMTLRFSNYGQEVIIELP
jgi:hypothetical protein